MAWRESAAVLCLCLVGACGSLPRVLINGGQEVEQAVVDARYPWFVVFVTVDDCQAFCGGALVGPASVLTAAHCFFDAPDAGIDNPNVRAVLGYAGPVNTPADPEELLGCDLPGMYEIKSARKPVFYQYKTGYDVAVVTLDDFAGCPSVNPVKMAGGGFNFSAVLGSTMPWTLLGFGATEDESGAPSTYLNMLQSPVTSVGDWDARCNHEAADRIPSLICIEEEPGVRQGGSGDSGGPSIVFHPELGSAHVQVGVVSSSQINDAGQQFGYIVSPAWFQDWIASNILRTDPCLPEPPPEPKHFFIGYELDMRHQFCYFSACMSCADEEVTNPTRMRGKRAPRPDGCSEVEALSGACIRKLALQVITIFAVFMHGMGR